MASGNTESDHTEAMWRQRGPGAPRRLKTYGAECGYVWEYFFAGRAGAEYRFEASATRGPFVTIVIVVDRSAVERAAGREVTEVEEYAAAKMSLLRAFDRHPPGEMPASVRPGADEFREIFAALDLL
jgi:hypothetical protein